METIRIDFSKRKDTVKPMHSVNNGPIVSRGISNIEQFRDAAIPFARIHDASFCSNYGGSHTVDIPYIFPNFDADENLPESYDFTLTDHYLETICSSGAQVFFRLGVKIEHEIKKYGIYPPKDFDKWARVCEHIVRRYNEGWAGGPILNIKYWEIWNEPDLHDLMWLGTDEQYYELYVKTAKHLKKCFPDIKVGGPAMCYIGPREFTEKFFETINREKAPLDFLSWHCYSTKPETVANTAVVADDYRKKYGRSVAELILDEWNWVGEWTPEGMKKAYRTMLDNRGAAFVAACMCECQRSPLDHLMYYDARPCAFNGLFEMGTLDLMRAYYSLWMWGQMYKAGNTVETASEAPIYTAAATGDGKKYAMIAYYTEDDGARELTYSVALENLEGEYTETISSFDAGHNFEKQSELEADATCLRHKLTLKPNSVTFIEIK